MWRKSHSWGAHNTTKVIAPFDSCCFSSKTEFKCGEFSVNEIFFLMSHHQEQCIVGLYSNNCCDKEHSDLFKTIHIRLTASIRSTGIEVENWSEAVLMLFFTHLIFSVIFWHHAMMMSSTPISFAFQFQTIQFNLWTRTFFSVGSMKCLTSEACVHIHIHKDNSTDEVPKFVSFSLVECKQIETETLWCCHDSSVCNKYETKLYSLIRCRKNQNPLFYYHSSKCRKYYIVELPSTFYLFIYFYMHLDR